MVEELPALVARYHTRLYQYFRRLTRRARVAEDLMQEVCVRLLRGAPRDLAGTREAVWVFRLARSALIDYLRKTGREPELVDLDHSDLPLVPPAQVVALGVAQALDRLPAAARELLVLRELYGFRYDELAAIVGLSPGAVRTRVYRAREVVRAMLSARWARREPGWRDGG